jgi:spore coat polysaccharide biosynthesis protein SpsF
MKKPRIVAIVQARTGSTRLPNKVLMEIQGRTLLEHLISRLRRATLLDGIIIATSDKPRDQAVVELCKKLGVVVVTGSEDDVLDRFFKAATVAKADILVRVCGDQPLTDPDIVDEAIRQHLHSKADYSSTMLVRTFPQGVDAEVFSFEHLKKIHSLAKDPFQREHVTPYFYQHPEEFRLNKVLAPKELEAADIKLTVDTQEDFDRVKRIIEALGRKEFFDTRDVIAFVRTA